MTDLASAEVGATGRAAERGARRRDVQGLRALAVLAVMAYHAGLPVPGGFAGVDVFFVISGYVITAMLVREIQAHGRIRYLRFHVRRFKRLTPALALVLAVTMLFSAVLLSPFGTQQITAQTGLGAVFLVANFVIASTTGDYFDAPAEANPLLHTWSLSVEEQFYLFFPALLGLAWLGWRRRSAEADEGRNRHNDRAGRSPRSPASGWSRSRWPCWAPAVSTSRVPTCSRVSTARSAGPGSSRSERFSPSCRSHAGCPTCPRPPPSAASGSVPWCSPCS